MMELLIQFSVCLSFNILSRKINVTPRALDNPVTSKAIKGSE